MISRNVLCFILGTVSVGTAQTGVQIIHSRWGDIKHQPNALARAIKMQEVALINAFPELAGADGLQTEGTFSQRLENRAEAARATLRLPEVVRIQVEHTAGVVECEVAEPRNCHTEPVTVVLALYDVDGNRASIWTGSNDLDKTLQVTGVEPY